MRYRLRTLLIVSGFLLTSRVAYAGPQTIPPIGGPNLLVFFFLFCVGVALIVAALIAGLPIWLSIEIRKAKKTKADGKNVGTEIPFRHAILQALLWFAFSIVVAVAVVWSLFSH